MNFDYKSLDGDRSAITAVNCDKEAPGAVVAALNNLAGELPRASYITYQSAGIETTWEAYWVTESSLVHVKATKGLPDWNGKNETVQQINTNDVQGWVRPLSDVRKLSIAGQWTELKESALLRSLIRWKIELEGLAFTIPLRDDATDDEYELSGEFVRALKNAWLKK